MHENKQGLIQIYQNARKQPGGCPTESECTKTSRGLSKSIKIHEDMQGLVQINQNARNKQGLVQINQNAGKQQGLVQINQNARKQAGGCPNLSK